MCCLQPPPSPHRAAPRSGSSPVCSLLHPPIKQPRAAEAPPCAASSIPPSSSPAQRKLPRLLPRPSSDRAAPRSGSSPICSLLHPPIKQPRAAEAPPIAASSISPSPHRAAPRSGSSPNCCLVPPQIEQPRAAGAPLERASFLPSIEQLSTAGALPHSSLLPAMR